MKESLVARTGVSIGIIISIFWFPYWISILLALGGLFFFPKYREIVLMGLLMDTLYGSHSAGFHFSFFFTILAILIYTGFGYLKQRLTFY